MGIYTRVRDIVNANVNAVLDKAEDPEKLVKLMIREMEDTLIEIKASCAGTMAAKKRAQREWDSANSRAQHWASRAELAVSRDRESLAREALRAKRRYESEAEAIAREVDQLAPLVDQYKDDINKIQDKLDTARERQRVLVQRHIHAVHRRRAEQEIRRLDSTEVLIRFEEFEQRLDQAEAEAELVNYGHPARGSLEDQFAQMESDEAIEEELQALMEANRGGSVSESA